jgi:hypothetical protein
MRREAEALDRSAPPRLRRAHSGNPIGPEEYVSQHLSGARARRSPAVIGAVTLAFPLLCGASANAQGMSHDMHGMAHENGGASAPQRTAPLPPASSAQETPAQIPEMGHQEPAASSQPGMPGMEHGGHEMGGMHMRGQFGPYPMSREGSGTAWNPDSTPHQGVEAITGDWMLMGHASLFGVYDHQGGPRGASKTFAPGMLMGMAQRPVGEAGTFGFRAMLSPDPFMGANGYPLLFATGETANGRTPLIDRQHPHDLFMELSGSYSHRLSETDSAFLYFGLPGEPALGPPAFMHRFSGMDIPEAPITHHWLDSTHITYGVLTAGYIRDKFKVEVSGFRGREPDQHRYNIERPALDSIATRLTWNPTRDLSGQVSWGYLKSPEQLEPNVNENRVTASLTYNKPFGDGNNWATTFAWGRKMNRPGNTLDGFLLESAVVLQDTHTLFGRAERVNEDELLGHAEHASTPVFTPTKFSLGYIYDFQVAERVKLGIGGLASRYIVPKGLDAAYGSDPTSFMTFIRLKIQ